MNTRARELRRKLPWAGATIRRLVAVHAEESAFLWLVRDRAVHAPHYLPKQLQDLDERIAGHLQGISVAGPDGLAICRDVLELDDAGEVFTYAASSIVLDDEETVRAIVDVALGDQGLRRGVASALAWLPWAVVKGHISDLARSQEPRARALAITALALRRIDPGDVLREALVAEEETLRIAALRAIGLLGRHDLTGQLREATVGGSLAVRCAAAWSGSVRCDVTCTNQLYKLAADVDVPSREELLQLAFRRFDHGRVSQILTLAGLPGRRRDAILAAGAFGDPVMIPWLFDQMAEPDFARLAGESFVWITGADFERERLIRDTQPPQSRQHADPDPLSGAPDVETESEADAEVDPPLDRDLYWPDRQEVMRWWNRNEGSFRSGTRFLAGKALTPENLTDIIRDGYQRQRAAAALELVALQIDRPLPEVRAAAYRRKAR